MHENKKLKKLGFIKSFSIYIPAAILMYVLTQYMIPYLTKLTGIETVFFWFVVGGLGIFTPLIVAGIFILKSEGYKLSKETWVHRLRFRKITKRDAIWAIVGLIAIGALSGLVMKILVLIIGEFDHSPAFMSFEPLNKGRYWLLLIWLPYWILNILGEEFLWRGVMLPRQELVFGKYTWLIHGFGWSLFHIAFGWQLMLTLLPILFIQPYIVQKTKNSWLGVILHGGLNGPSFIAICFGFI
ncbi:MAG: CPBP family intramembrane metalloprotease [Bacteroidetes bacterium]|nr:CPBP family intramembrane metalloprotease [Bacteroidota bacterium]